MRRWMEMYTDASQSAWFYTKGQAGQGFNTLWIAMPPKLQFVEYLNNASNQFMVLLKEDQGKNVGSEIENFSVELGITRVTNYLFNPLPASSVFLFWSSTQKPTNDSVDALGQAWKIEHWRKPGDRWQPK